MFEEIKKNINLDFLNKLDNKNNGISKEEFLNSLSKKHVEKIIVTERFDSSFILNILDEYKNNNLKSNQSLELNNFKVKNKDNEFYVYFNICNKKKDTDLDVIIQLFASNLYTEIYKKLNKDNLFSVVFSLYFNTKTDIKDIDSFIEKIKMDYFKK